MGIVRDDEGTLFSQIVAHIFSVLYWAVLTFELVGTLVMQVNWQG